MKTQSAKKIIAFITKMILSVCILVSNNSCQKVRNAVTEITKISGSSSIIYTDLMPDTIRTCSGTCNKNYYLDLNKDGINDFSFSVSSGPAYHCSGMYRNSAVGVLPSNSNSVTSSKLSLNEIIGNNSLWSNTSQILRKCTAHCFPDVGNGGNSFSYTGNWATSTDGYLSLKIYINNQVYYGWARLSLSAIGFGASFTIKDYAYNASANQSILAGQTK